jgi:hypothetical protein
MSQSGQDYLWIGLGLGALYLVYKLSKPVSDLFSSVADLGTNTVNTVTDTVKTVSDNPSSIIAPLPSAVYNYYNTLAPETKSNIKNTALDLIAPIPRAVSNIIKSSSSKSSSKPNVLDVNKTITASAKVANVTGVNSQALNYVLGKTTSPITVSTKKPNVLAKSVVFK